MNSYQDKPDHHHYVVTEDFCVLMRSWAQRTGFTIPEARWFVNNHLLLRRALEDALKSDDRVVLVDSLPHQYMSSEIQTLVDQQKARKGIYPDCVISLDRVYTLNMRCPHHLLDVNRVTDLATQHVQHFNRPGFPPLDDQIDALLEPLTSHHVIVVDDGIWTGETLQWIVQKLYEHSVFVDAVVVGVQVKHAGSVVEYAEDHNTVKAVQVYAHSRPVVDWVCERDFFFGTPLGGRTIHGREQVSVGDARISVGAFYPARQDWLSKWASIEDRSGAFRTFCRVRSLELFKEVERLSGRSVRLRDLERIPLHIVEDGADYDASICTYLH